MPRMALLLLLHIGTAAARWVIFVKTWQQNILPKIWGRDSSLCFSAYILLTRDKGSIRDCQWKYILEASVACSVIIAWLKFKYHIGKLDLKCKSNFISERYGPKKEILEHYLLFVVIVILKVIPWSSSRWSCSCTGCHGRCSLMYQTRVKLGPKNFSNDTVVCTRLLHIPYPDHSQCEYLFLNVP